MDEDDLGPKRIVALQKEAEEWARQADEAIVSIQDITVNYFKETVKALAGNHLRCYTNTYAIFILSKTKRNI